MKELSLNILDIIENSIKSGAKNVELIIEEESKKDLLSIVVKDDGKGMDESFLKIIFDPFTTTSTNKNVGLGLPLLKEEAESCGGGVEIQSDPGKGTVVIVKFKRSHIDRPPIGDLVSTILSVIATNPDIRFFYKHRVDSEIFKLDTEEIKEIVGEMSFRSVKVLKWVESYLRENTKSLYGGDINGKN